MRSLFVFSVSVLGSIALGACSSRDTGPIPATGHETSPHVVQSGQPPVNWEAFQAWNVSSHAEGLAVGADGDIWYEVCCNAWGFGKMAMDGTTTTYPVLQSNAPGALVRGPKSRLWFTELFQDIGSITTDGTITNYQIPIPNEYATSLTIGPDRNIWFSEEQGGGKQRMIGRMTPEGHFLSSFPVPGGANMTKGSDGRVWIPQVDNNSIEAITATGQVTVYHGLTEPAGQIIPGPDGNLWFVERDYIGKMTTSGVLTEYSEPTSLNPTSLTVGPDKRIWFTSFDSPWLGRVSLSGQTKFFQNPRNDLSPERTIITGPDHNLWFAENNYLGVYVHLVLTVQPQSITFSATGQTQTISVTEKKYIRSWTATSLNPAVATVTPASPNTFTVTAVGSGSTSIDVADAVHNDFLVKVSVP